jgi:tRNA A58 N-methylase Trm61
MPLKTDYRTIMAAFIKIAKFTSVLEIGVANGGSTIVLLNALPDWGHLWSVDLRACLKAREKYGEIWKNKWTFYFDMDSLKLEWNMPIDMIFIDSSHDFEFTLKELRKFSPFAKHIIFMHDTRSHPQVTQALETFLKEDEKWAWGEWKHASGMGILMRIKPE